MTQVDFVIDSLATGGAERMLLRQLQHFDREPIVHKLGGPNDLKEEFVAADASIIDIGDLSSGYFQVVNRLRKELLASKPDVVHAHLPNAHVVARPAAKLAGVESVICTHHNVASSNSYRSTVGKLEKYTRFLDDVEVAVSETVRESHKMSFVSENWHVILNSIDVTGYHEKIKNAPRDLYEEYHPVFLNVGRYAPQKGQKDIIKAMPGVLDEFPKAIAVIVGWGELEESLNKLADDLGVTEHVSITGRVDTVYEYYNSADIFVFPSHWEGFGIVLLEAMAAELPTVGSDVGPIPELIDEKFGKTVPPKSPEDLAEDMISLGKLNIEKYGNAAYQNIKNNYSMNSYVDSYEKLYAGL
jgi:glycosyltransferase involved in cell wall biosynthesis